jgi:hypothetical protein
MSDAAATRRQFGEGPLARVAALVYTLLVVEGLFLVVSAPGLVALFLLYRDLSNIPLAAVCALPFGPAFAAALYAVHHRHPDPTELRPAAAFWRGYRLNVGGALTVWVPWLVWLTIIGMTLANLAVAGVPRWWAALLVIVAAGATLWVANALVITSLFSFRAVDVARLAAYFLVRTVRATLGAAGLVAVAVGVIVLSSELVLALLASVFAFALLQTSRPLIVETREEFTS